MNQVIEVCHCGHDKATHYEQKHACLGMGCDPECHGFVNRNAPDVKERTQRPTARPSFNFTDNKPHLDGDCQCDACVRWAFRRRTSYPYGHWPP